MPRIALVEGPLPGSVRHVIVAAADHADPSGLVVVASDTANVGDVWDGETFAAPVAPRATRDQLFAAAYAEQATRRDCGIVVDIGTAAVPRLVNVATDVGGFARVHANVAMIDAAARLKKAPPSFCWDNGEGEFATLDAGQMRAVCFAMDTYLQATQAMLGTVIAGIGDSIESAADVAAAPWPSTRVSAVDA